MERDALIERYLLQMQMPEEYATWRAVILCNDCVTESELPYHFAFHRCPHLTCHSFNTDVLRTFRIDAPDDNPHRTALQSQQSRASIETKEADLHSPQQSMTDEERRLGGAADGVASTRSAGVLRPFTQAQDILAELRARQAEEDSDGEEDEDEGEEGEEEEEEGEEDDEALMYEGEEEEAGDYQRWQDDVDDDGIDDDDGDEEAAGEVDDAHQGGS